MFRGAKIIGELESDTVWKPLLNNNLVYTATKEENQTVTFEGKRANDFFMELENHMPVLKIEADKT